MARCQLRRQARDGTREYVATSAKTDKGGAACLLWKFFLDPRCIILFQSCHDNYFIADCGRTGAFLPRVFGAMDFQQCQEVRARAVLVGEALQVVLQKIEEVENKDTGTDG